MLCVVGIPNRHGDCLSLSDFGDNKLKAETCESRGPGTQDLG